MIRSSLPEPRRISTIRMSDPLLAMKHCAELNWIVTCC